MNNIIPSFYLENEPTLELIMSMITELKISEEVIDDILLQMYIDTATWGLEHWERMLGLKVANNTNLEDRRARIKMKLRGTGVFNREMIMNLCKSFTNGDVCVLENNLDNSFVIKFVDIKGIPGNINYLRDAIEEVKPAHLNYIFEYLYTVCQKYIEWNMSCTDVLVLTCNEMKVYTKI